MSRILSPLLRAPHGDRDIATADEWASKALDIRRRFIAMVGEPPFGDTFELDARIEDEAACDKYVRYRITYAVERDERVAAWLLIPHDLGGPVSAVLCLHQTVARGKDEPVGLAGSRDLAYAHHLAERGFVCLAPDHLAAGERVRPGLKPYETSAFYEKHPGWSAVGKAIWDAGRAVDVLSARAEVDANRIGAIGHSLGGHSAVFAAAFDDRIRACVTNCGLTTFADNPKRLAWARDEWYVYIPALRPILLTDEAPPFDFHEIVALLAPRACLNITALDDETMGISARATLELTAEVREVYRMLGVEDRFATYLHDVGHSFPPESRELAYAFLARELG